eukprot:499485_1
MSTSYKSYLCPEPNIQINEKIQKGQNLDSYRKQFKIGSFVKGVIIKVDYHTLEIYITTLTQHSPHPYHTLALNFIKNTSDTIAAATNDNYNENILRLKKAQSINREKVKEIFANKKWIWVNGHFHDSDRVAFRHPSSDSINCSPYLEIISSSYGTFKKLFIECDVRDKFSPRDYGNILNIIHEKYNKNVIKNEIDINLTVNISQYLSDRMNVIGDLLFPIPCDNNSMQFANDLYYNDAPWIKSRKKTIKFVHPKLSINVCKKLGVNSFRELFVSKNSESLSFEFGNQLQGTKAFGQHESLTRRLKDILRSYPEGPSIIYEFIQNADDAKATKVIILLNEKQYNTDSLLSTQLKQFQGPNLMIYNNSTFDERDFINLSRIGQGSKLQKLEATGRFGLGFNCCYHLTDVPSLVSSKSIVFFDPHTTHLPNANSNAPGIRINYLHSDLVNTFPDQFKPFQDFQHIFGCKLDEEFNGTLFRFPLRNANIAKNSEIKSEITSVESVKQIIYKFSKFAKETLLFLRYVCEIQLMIADKDGKINNILNVQVKDKKQRMKSVWRNFIEKGLSSAASNKNQSNQMTSTDRFYRYLQRLNKTKLPIGIKSIKIISHNYPQKNEKKLDAIEHKTNDNNIEQKKDDNKIDIEQKVEIITDEFVICEKIGGGDTVSIACKKENRDLKLIPFGCVAAHISSSDKLEFNVLNGRAFTFLPLPIKTGLPIHINSYFELSANRRDLWWGLDMHGVGAQRHKWNESLLRHVLAPAYTHLIQYIAKSYGKNLSNIINKYYGLFPHKVNNGPFMELMQYFYTNISNLNVLYSPANDGQWLSPAKCIAFMDEMEHKSNHINDDMDGKDNKRINKIRRIRNILLKCDISVVTLQKFLVEHLKKSGLNQYSSIWLRTKFLSSFTNKQLLERLSYEDCIFLLELCLDDINSDNISQFYNLPILPLSNGTFTKFLTDKVSPNKRVFFTTDQKFIDLLRTAPTTDNKENKENDNNNNNISTRVIASDLPSSITSKL